MSTKDTTTTNAPEFSIDRLGKLITRHLNAASAFGKRTTSEVWHAGRYLLQAKVQIKSTKGGTWGEFLKSLSASATTIQNAIKVYKHFDTAESAGELGITEAYHLAGCYPAAVAAANVESAHATHAPQDETAPARNRIKTAPMGEAKTTPAVQEAARVEPADPAEQVTAASALQMITSRLEELADEPLILTPEDVDAVERSMSALTRILRKRLVIAA